MLHGSKTRFALRADVFQPFGVVRHGRDFCYRSFLLSRNKKIKSKPFNEKKLEHHNLEPRPGLGTSCDDVTVKTFLLRASGCLPFSQKIRKFRFEVKWKGNFPENLFGNCGQPPDVEHFFRSEWNSGNALTICENRSVSIPGPFSKDLVNMRDGMPSSKNGKRHSHPVGHYIRKIAYLCATIIPSGLFG